MIKREVSLPHVWKPRALILAFISFSCECVDECVEKR